MRNDNEQTAGYGRRANKRKKNVSTQFNNSVVPYGRLASPMPEVVEFTKTLEYAQAYSSGFEYAEKTFRRQVRQRLNHDNPNFNEEADFGVQMSLRQLAIDVEKAYNDGAFYGSIDDKCYQVHQLMKTLTDEAVNRRHERVKKRNNATSGCMNFIEPYENLIRNRSNSDLISNPKGKKNDVPCPHVPSLLHEETRLERLHAPKYMIERANAVVTHSVGGADREYQKVYNDTIPRHVRPVHRYNIAESYFSTSVDTQKYRPEGERPASDSESLDEEIQEIVFGSRPLPAIVTMTNEEVFDEVINTPRVKPVHKAIAMQEAMEILDITSTISKHGLNRPQTINNLYKLNKLRPIRQAPRVKADADAKATAKPRLVDKPVVPPIGKSRAKVGVEPLKLDAQRRGGR